MNIAVVGSRGFTDYELLRRTLLEIIIKHDLNDLCIISGGARGADSLAEQFAKDKGIKLKYFILIGRNMVEVQVILEITR